MMMMVVVVVVAVQFPHTTRRNIAEGSNLQGDHHENVKYHNFPFPFTDQ